MSDWLEHSVEVEVAVPVELAWNLWSDLELMPLWMKWIESVDGLPNRGAIRFYDRSGETCIVRLSVSYAVPGILKKIIDGPFLRKIVDSSLLGDLERFRQYAIEHKS